MPIAGNQGKKAVVVGAGVAGLAAAVRLAVKGYRVEVFEARDEPGGKLHGFSLGPWRFDAGPSLFTMPQQVDELFRLAGKEPSDYFRYRRLEDACTYFWPDGASFKAWSDPVRFADAAERTFGVPKGRILEHLAHTRRLMATSGSIFLEKPLGKVSTWLHPSVATSLMALRATDLLFTMDRLHRVRIGEPHLVQLFNRFATYNGSDPYRTPGMMTMIAALEHGQGVFLPEGGMVSITRALHRLGEELGVAYHFGTPVERILVRDDRVRGIRAVGEEIPADVVVSNMDIWYTYRRLLEGMPAPERTLRQERSSSALVFYWGMREAFPQLGLHNIFFSGDYPGEFRALFRGERPGQDPTVYVNIGSKLEPGDAPPGGENWFVMVNVPRHTGQDWESIRMELREKVLAKISRALGGDIEPLIGAERHWDPPGIEAHTLSYQGALYGNSSNNMFSAFLRHPNAHPRFGGLLHVGGTVHPGGGIPLCLLSARIAVDHL